MVNSFLDMLAGHQLPKWSTQWSFRLAAVGFLGACASQLLALVMGIDTWDCGIVAFVWPFFYAFVLLCGRGMVWQGQNPVFQRVFGTTLTAYSRFLGIAAVLVFPGMVMLFSIISFVALALGAL
jgi:hypothetical protein